MVNAENVHAHSLVEFADEKPEARESSDHWFARGQNFAIEWVDVTKAGGAFEITADEEAMVVLPEIGATIEGQSQKAVAKGRSVCIVPPGTYQVSMAEVGSCVCLFSDPDKLASPKIVNSDVYETADPRVAPVGKPMKRADGSTTITVIEIDGITTEGKNSAMKVLQSATMSINWVERHGVRDRSDLTPHDHPDFEQGSVAMLGDFIHHLRVPWGKNANLWRDDVHTRANRKSVLISSVGLVHTTEAIENVQHVLLDVFAPARQDFIQKGYVANSDDYVMA
ncbi:MAG: hypothetical protein HN403_18870 [Rhodospirillales bacterium]|jgi:hypothetical protein|nr:hypothetical protein [Rhodospirillales bacterium]